MKRISILCAALLALAFLLAGCSVTSPRDGEFQDAWNESMDEIQKDLEDRRENADGKDHFWKVLDAGGQELYTITDEEAVKALDDLLNGDEEGWSRLEEDPDDPAYSYVYSQEKTLLAGQDPDEEREYEDLMVFTVSASKDVVTMEILAGPEALPQFPEADLYLSDLLTFSASVPAKTAEALRDTAQFTEQGSGEEP